MRISPWLWGAFLGAVTSLPLMALMFLASQLALVPFVPFDLFDWIARAMPGNVLAVLIDSMVKVILLLNWGRSATLPSSSSRSSPSAQW